jgi:hypothetical protein
MPPSQTDMDVRPGGRRDRIAQWLAIATVVGLAAILFGTAGLNILMPGPLASAHGGVEACSACHTNSGTTKLSWLHGLVAGDRAADSKACLTCHKMPQTAMNAHGAPAEVLKESTVRLTKLAMGKANAGSTGVQGLLSPMHVGDTRGPFCGTCHQEHQGASFDLRTITNEQCQSCHVLKFDHFDKDHPEFSNYPFETRTRIVFDHAGHFGKHYPETAKKEPDKRIPETCSSCHDSRGDKRVMAVAPFEKTCASCHGDQITGKQRVSGPKGIAFLALPGLDLETLRKKNAAIGEWPDGSEATLTPFMKVMISRNDNGRAITAALEGLNLQDLSQANDTQIKAVTDMAWEIKRLLNGLIAGKASDILADLNIVQGTKLSASLVGDLTASIPRDVLLAAQQQWLPNLGREIANGPMALDAQLDGKAQDVPEPAPAAEAPDDKPEENESADTAPPQDEKAKTKAERDPPACTMRVFGTCLVSKDQSTAANGSDAPPSFNETPEVKSRLLPADPFPQPMRAGLGELSPPKPVESAANEAQSDELLFPTEDELRELKSRNARSARRQPAQSGAPGGAPAGDARPVISIDSGIDPESWADIGGWYRQDHTIFYRPTGHKDKFIYSWLFLTGPQAPKEAATPVAAVFNSFTGKDAPGSCTKCHSVDEVRGKGRIVNFGPLTAASKAGRFTRFVHEPHLTIKDDRGCLTCHSLAKDRTYLKSYEHGEPKTFMSNFDPVKRDVCQSCHNSSKARQDCQNCHSYHVNGVATPAMQTKLPAQ